MTGMSFNWKILGALVIAAVLVVAAAWFVQFNGLRKSTGVVPESTGAVPGGPPISVSGVQSFADFINSLPESKKDCVKKAYGPLYDDLIKKDPGFIIPAGEEWRVNEANKCFVDNP